MSISSAKDFKLFQDSVIIPKNNINLTQNIGLIIDNKIADIADNKKAVWGDLLISNLYHKTDSKQNGFDAISTGFIFGYDAEINKNNLLGSAIFYSNSNIDGEYNLQDDQNNSVGLSLYHKNYNEDKKGLFSFNKLISFYNFYSSKRRIYLGNEERRAKSSTSGLTANLETGFGYRYDWGKISYIPKLSYQYFRDQISSYREKGAGDLSLNISKNSYNSHKLQFGLDLAASKNIEHQNLEYRPQFGIYFAKKIAGTKNQKIDINFVNNNKYKIELPDINDDYLTTILSFDLMEKAKKPIVNFKYIGNFSQDINSHLASLNFKYNF